MPMTVTLQVNADHVAGDWATRAAGSARTATGSFGARARTVHTDPAEEAVVRMADLRGAVEAIQLGVDSATIAETRTRFADLVWGAPAMYHGMRFAVGYA